MPALVGMKQRRVEETLGKEREGVAALLGRLGGDKAEMGIGLYGGILVYRVFLSQKNRLVYGLAIGKINKHKFQIKS
jgi:hypothetical protein